MRRILALVVSAGLLLAFAATATGNVAAECRINPSDGSPLVNISATNFRTPAGVMVSPTFRYNGINKTYTFEGRVGWDGDFMYTGPGTVTMTYWSKTYTAEVPNCLPEPPPVPPTREVTPPPPPPALTCADRLARYPKAGPVRRAQWGCPAPVIKLPPNPDKPPIKRTPPKRVVTCGWILGHYSGQARKNMIRKHNISPNCGRPFNPPVAG